MEDECVPQEYLRVEPETNNVKGELLLIPTAIGLYRPLDKGYANMASILGSLGYSVRVLEFPGQNKRPGSYSVYGSCLGLAKYLLDNSENDHMPIYIFGICTGALAALYASLQIKRIELVFCWEISPTYEYTVDSYHRLESKYGLSVNWERALRPIQPIEIVSKSPVKIIFGMSGRSQCTVLKEQEYLASLAESANVTILGKTSHVPGNPIGSEWIIAHEIDKYCLSPLRIRPECEKYF